ncbi:hypothetical protein LV89_01111 [Arcicella aurantiaca]|uniref:Uncharacterized protein n=1 Tax=Arcicella aurantiaca TaxID=591202 RepID=A0A316EF64_9BACT|nr:hypothetical protein [Arcicella aurantiaca]PWK28328.1 hypothetical protein LV89_01111 [Arcicella aurantiaca]
MLKIDYILLARHFRGETSEEENTIIDLWREQSVMNGLTYKRLQKVSKSENSVEEKVISKEERIVWKKIITKILAEEDLSV